MPPKRAPPPRRGAAATPKQEPDPESAAEQSTAGANAETSIEINSTQATPAGTPAPSNPALQRADSASRPPSGSASARGTPSARGASSGRGGPAGRGRAAVAKPKFAGRRSQKSRAELEKEEGERRKEEADRKAKEDARNLRRNDARNRGAFRGRQRGGYMGEGERKKDVPVMSGPFSSGQAITDSSKRHAPSWAARSGGGGGGPPGVGGGGGGGAGAGSGYGSYSGGRGPGGVKSEYGGGDPGAFIKAEDGGYISSDDDEEDKAAGGRRNIDDLAYIDLTGDDDAPNAGRSSFAPVRIQRVEHKERTIGINTEGLKDAEVTEKGGKSRSLSPTLRRKDKGKQKAGDVEITGEQHRYQGVYSESSSEQEGEPRIKVEHAEDEPNRTSTPEPPAHDAANIPNAPFQSPNSSPEARRKSKPRIKSPVTEKPKFQTHEEETEWDLHQKDLRILRDELGTLSVAADKEGDAAMSGTDGQPQPQDDPRADKVYLFQFPPVLPPLTPITVKPDPDAPSAPTDSNAENPISIPEATPASTSKQAAAPTSGHVGKLRIHASGRATLDWGGTAMEVGMGTEASFLQDVIIAEFERKAKEGASGDSKEGVKAGRELEKEIVGGTAMGMGQVKGKFVVTPDWEEILR